MRTSNALEVYVNVSRGQYLLELCFEVDQVRSLTCHGESGERWADAAAGRREASAML
jgi:hypothetical protein